MQQKLSSNHDANWPLSFNVTTHGKSDAIQTIACLQSGVILILPSTWGQRRTLRWIKRLRNFRGTASACSEPASSGPVLHHPRPPRMKQESTLLRLSLIHISEPTRLGMISYA